MIPLQLFAVRDSGQESLGFTPFELVFGHNVRGPLKWVKEKCLDSEEKMDLLSYVTTFKDRLAHACTMASKHLEHAKSDIKRGMRKKLKHIILRPEIKPLF